MVTTFSFAPDADAFVLFNGQNLWVQRVQTLQDFVVQNPNSANNLANISCSPATGDWIVCWHSSPDGRPPNRTGSFFEASLSRQAYPDLWMKLYDNSALLPHDRVISCNLGPPPFFYLRCAQNLHWNTPDSLQPSFDIFRRLSLTPHLLQIAFGPGESAIFLFSGGFFLWTLPTEPANADLELVLQQAWARGDWLEAASIASDPSGLPGAPFRFFLRFGADYNIRLSQNSIGKVQELMSNAPPGELQMFLATRLLGASVTRNLNMRQNQVRQAMIERHEESHRDALSIAGLVDFSNLQQAARVEALLQQWLTADVPRPRDGTGNLRHWIL